MTGKVGSFTPTVKHVLSFLINIPTKLLFFSTKAIVIN